MKKKVLSLILAAVMALSLAACGGGSKDGTEADGTTAAPKGTEAEGESAEGGSAGGETITGPIEVVELEPFKVYNVRRGVWHAVETEENTSILITENDDTSPQNTPKMPISPKDLPAWQKRKPT